MTSPFTLYEQVIRAGEMAQRTPKGPIYLNVALEHMLHDWTPPENDRDVPFAPRVEPHAERSGKGRRPSARGEKSDHRRRAVRPRSGGVQGAGRACRSAGDPGDVGPRRQFCQFPDRSSALSRRRHLRASQGRRSRPARRRPRALVSAAHPADQGQDRRDQREPVQRPHDLSAAARRRLSRRRHRGRAAGADEIRARGEDRRRGREEAPRALDQTARRLRRRPESRKSQGQRRRQGDRSAGADRHARRSDAGRHDLCRRDHPARPDAAPASALHHAAKFLPRFWRPRPRARHRARRQTRRAPNARWRCSSATAASSTTR